ncbi:TIGR02680 family protein [Streptomyces sp. NPDC002838]|uniref:TIGR02680 family protein n=1 Tax=Streptomyces sp. NPDC002838 TaxID=3154436 RepID=UPI00331E10D4
MTIFAEPSPSGDAPTVRFKPTRAGIIGLWDYRDEEFVFADGRLVLRGHNGSGKTKALEVLFPLVLDGSIDPRRLDPFSGEERTMKSNLLYRGQESAYGYVWMEFTRTTADGELLEAVTVGLGLLAQKSKERPGRFFFVSDGRIGVDFGLLTADSRPLRKKELEKLIGPDAVCKTATEYREAIDDRLFGLGRQRYAQLINLLLQLRRPLLAKDLDPDKLSDTLTAGLRPVDDALIAQAARDFENLAEIQAVLDSLTKADGAVQDFLRDYTAYLRAHARDRVEQINARCEATTGHCDKIATAAQDRRAADAALQAAKSDRDEAAAKRKKLGAHVEGLRNHDALKQEVGLRELRDRVRGEGKDIAGTESRLEKMRQRVARLTSEADGVGKGLDQLRGAADRHTQTLLSAGQAASLVTDDDPLDLTVDLLTHVESRATVRRHDIGEVHGYLDAAERAAQDQRREQDRFDAADKEVTDYDSACTQSADVLAATRSVADAELRKMIDRWTGTDPTAVLIPMDAPTLVDALEAVGEPDAPALPEVFRSLTDERRTSALSQQESLKRRHTETQGQLAAVRAERAQVAAERDDAPPASDLRPADRSGRAGAPLWQLIRFADHVPHEQAAAVEGALYGAGLLTAWLHPHADATVQAFTDSESDGYLLPLPAAQRPTGQTLADVLVPEEQSRVPAEAVAAVLASVRLTNDLSPDIGESPAVSSRAQFTLGIQLGAHPKARPEYIGATARAARRRERLHALDETISAMEDDLADLVAAQQAAAETVADFDTARQQLPPTASIVKAVRDVEVTAVQLAGARKRRDAAHRALDLAIANTHDKERRLRRAATAAGLPAQRDALADVERAVNDFVTAGNDLHTTRSTIRGTEKDLDDRRASIAEQSQDYAEQTEALTTRKADHEALVERLRTEEALLDAPLRDLQRQLEEAQSALEEANTAYDQADAEAQAQQTRLTTAENALEHISEALTTALDEQLRTTAGLKPYTRPDLLRLLEAPTDTPWTPVSAWPTAEQAAAQVITQLTAHPPQLSPDDAARSALPSTTVTLLGAVDTATHGRRATENVLKTTTTKISTALTDLENALAESDQGYHLEWEPDGDIILARVSDAEGPAPVSEFGRRLAEQVADQHILLEDRERTVMEDALLTGLAQQIHSRTIEARNLVKAMDADTRAKPMSSGTTVGIRWVQSDALTDEQRAVNQLLKKDAAALGPAGLAELRSLLRAQIRAGKARDRRKTYQQIIADVLDYRSWRTFELLLSRPGEKEEKLTRSKHSEMSGGEKSASIHLPLFAAAHAQYGSAHPTCPRLIALDEAFAGIDEQYRPDLLALTVKFDLDLFMTGHDLWITYPTVPRIAHYDMNYDKASHTVSAMLMLWDGQQILDDLGYPGSDELAASLLGFTPSRHAPSADGLLAGLDDHDTPDDQPEEEADEA